MLFINHLSLGFPFCFSRFCFSKNLLNWQRLTLYTNASLLKGTEINIQCWANRNPAFRPVLICVKVGFLQRSKSEGIKNEGLCCLFLGFVLFLDGEFFLRDACAFFEFVFPFRELSCK